MCSSSWVICFVSNLWYFKVLGILTWSCRDWTRLIPSIRNHIQWTHRVMWTICDIPMFGNINMTFYRLDKTLPNIYIYSFTKIIHIYHNEKQQKINIYFYNFIFSKLFLSMCYIYRPNNGALVEWSRVQNIIQHLFAQTKTNRACQFLSCSVLPVV